MMIIFNHLRYNNMNKEKNMRDWLWGDYEILENHVGFCQDDEGGYRCRICRQKLCKEWKVLKLHLSRIHGKTNCTKVLLHIPTIKNACPNCPKYLEARGSKMKRHWEQSCQGNPQEEVTEDGENSDEDVEGEREYEEVERVTSVKTGTDTWMRTWR